MKAKSIKVIFDTNVWNSLPYEEMILPPLNLPTNPNSTKQTNENPSMQKVQKQIFIELIWLILAFGSAVLLGLLFFGKNFLTDTVDIRFSNTFFIIDPLHFLLALFLLITFIIYFIKEFRHSFRRAIPNWILIIVGLTIVAGVAFLFNGV